MAQPAYPISSISLVAHSLVLACNKLLRTAKSFRLAKISLKKLWLASITVGLIVLSVEAAGIPNATKTPTAKQYLEAAQHRTSEIAPIEYSAWLSSANESEAFDSLAYHPQTFGMIMPVWYKINSDGNLRILNNITRKEETQRLAAGNKIMLVPTIGNDFDSARVSKILDNEVTQQVLINAMVDEAKSNNYAGFDLDWEQLDSGDGQGYADFVQELASDLHANGKTLSIDVPAPSTKGYDSDQDSAFDLKRLGQSADQIRVMAYDFHYEESDPGAVTPLDAFEETVKHVRTLVAANKLSVGLPDYGYDWNVKTKHGVAVEYTDAISTVKQHHGTWKRDKATNAYVGHYSLDGNDHVIWLNDATSVHTQVAIARSFGVYQFSFWKLGGEDTATWQTRDK